MRDGTAGDEFTTSTEITAGLPTIMATSTKVTMGLSTIVEEQTKPVRILSTLSEIKQCPSENKGHEMITLEENGEGPADDEL